MKKLIHLNDYNHQHSYILYSNLDDYIITIDDVEVPFSTNVYQLALDILYSFRDESLDYYEAHKILLDVMKGQ